MSHSRIRLFALAIAATLMLSTGPVLAHAFLDHASPPVGSTLDTPPVQLELWFTQNLEPAFSGAEVVDEHGTRVDTGAPAIDGATMKIGLKPLSPGEYTVRWHVISVDTHATKGDFPFTVKGK